MPRTVMPHPEGPKQHGPGMVPGINAGGFLFLSAIRGRDPAAGKASDDPHQQARQALRNLADVLAASGASLADVVKVTLYLHDLKYRTPFHEVWMEVFPKDPPARIAFQVADANPAPGGNAHFALDVIALAPETKARRVKSARSARAVSARRPKQRKRNAKRRR